MPARGRYGVGRFFERGIVFSDANDSAFKELHALYQSIDLKMTFPCLLADPTWTLAAELATKIATMLRGTAVLANPKFQLHRTAGPVAQHCSCAASALMKPSVARTTKRSPNQVCYAGTRAQVCAVLCCAGCRRRFSRTRAGSLRWIRGRRLLPERKTFVQIIDDNLALYRCDINVAAWAKCS